MWITFFVYGFQEMLVCCGQQNCLHGATYVLTVHLPFFSQVCIALTSLKILICQNSVDGPFRQNEKVCCLL